MLDGGCGGDLLKPDGATPFADGAVRVFVSGVTDTGARIAVNGVQTEAIGIGDSVELTVDASPAASP